MKISEKNVFAGEIRLEGGRYIWSKSSELPLCLIQLRYVDHGYRKA